MGLWAVRGTCSSDQRSLIYLISLLLQHTMSQFQPLVNRYIAACLCEFSTIFMRAERIIPDSCILLLQCDIPRVSRQTQLAPIRTILLLLGYKGSPSQLVNRSGFVFKHFQTAQCLMWKDGQGPTGGMALTCQIECDRLPKLASLSQSNLLAVLQIRNISCDPSPHGLCRCW